MTSRHRSKGIGGISVTEKMKRRIVTVAGGERVPVNI